MICVTRAREMPSRRAISARDATCPASSCRCHSSAFASLAASPRGSLGVVAARSRFLARAKSTTMHVAKFLFEADLGSREFESTRVGSRSRCALERFEAERVQRTGALEAAVQSLTSAKRFDEFVDGHPSIPNQRPEKTCLQLRVIGDRERRPRIGGVAQSDVAATLAHDLVADGCERPHCIATRYAR